MKICFATSRLGEASCGESEKLEGTLDGSSRITHELATEMARLGHDVVAVTDAPKSNLQFLNRDYEVTTIGSRFSLANITRFSKMVRDIRPDIIHFHGGQPISIYAKMFKIGTALPVVFTYTFIPSLVRQSLKIQSRVARSFTSRTLSLRSFRKLNFDHVIALTKFARTRLVRDERIPPETTSVIHYGIPRASLEQPSQEQLQGRKGVVCTSGTTEERGLGTFLSSIQIVRPMFPDVDFAIAVRDRSELANVRQNPLDGIRIIGPGTLNHSVNSHPIVVMPFSKHAAVDPPISLLECMSWGKRVVSTHVGSITEILGIERGICVPPHNARALGKGVLQLLGDDSMGKSLADKAQAFIRNNYDWNRATDSVLDIYRST